ncbi:hypothetical protein N656DRAFT_379895 [Canariomyces notabilis]|uniref:Uncharacterized protein n=1 Tax=Canariomyces notabilis TaxID=2074819 RepID=A0AAN6TJ62_9PEZI|nr:hypothetical protein N656DRAFT_379895 [Canariomyces arenarius]
MQGPRRSGNQCRAGRIWAAFSRRVHISSGLVEEFRGSLLSAAFNVPDRGESGNREITERAGRGTYDGLVQIRRQGVATKSISHERIGVIAVVADVGQSPDRRAVTGKADGRDGRFAPPPLAWLDGLICARNIVIRTASALWPLFVAFLLLQYGSAGSWTRRPILTNLFLASPRGQKARVVSVFEGYNMKLIANRDATYQYVQPIWVHTDASALVMSTARCWGSFPSSSEKQRGCQLIAEHTTS